MKPPPIPQDTQGRTRKRARILFAVITVLLAVVGGCIYLNPAWASYVFGEVSPGCIFRKHTGLACPGCGGTRAIRAMMEGNFITAARYNIMLPLLAIGLLIEYLRLPLIGFTGAKDFHQSKWYMRSIIIFAWAVIAWFIVRNLIGV